MNASISLIKLEEKLLLMKLGKYKGIEDMPCGVCHTISAALENVQNTNGTSSSTINFE